MATFKDRKAPESKESKLSNIDKLLADPNTDEKTRKQLEKAKAKLLGQDNLSKFLSAVGNGVKSGATAVKEGAKSIVNDAFVNSPYKDPATQAAQLAKQQPAQPKWTPEQQAMENATKDFMSKDPEARKLDSDIAALEKRYSLATNPSEQSAILQQINTLKAKREKKETGFQQSAKAGMQGKVYTEVVNQDNLSAETGNMSVDEATRILYSFVMSVSSSVKGVEDVSKISGQRNKTVTAYYDKLVKLKSSGSEEYNKLFQAALVYMNSKGGLVKLATGKYGFGNKPIDFNADAYAEAARAIINEHNGVENTAKIISGKLFDAEGAKRKLGYAKDWISDKFGIMFGSKPEETKPAETGDFANSFIKAHDIMLAKQKELEQSNVDDAGEDAILLAIADAAKNAVAALEGAKNAGYTKCSFTANGPIYPSTEAETFYKTLVPYTDKCYPDLVAYTSKYKLGGTNGQ